MTATQMQAKKWDRDSYYKLAESGALRPGERVELIEGVITEMSPQNRRHARLIGRLTMGFAPRFSTTHVVRVQLPLDLGSSSQPEPDFALVTPHEDENCPLHPRCADLLVEVADSSLAYDRNDKASLYAKYGFPELWIVLAQEERVEVCRHPQPDPDAPYGHSYSYRVQLGAGQAITPLFAPTESFTIFPSSLLP